LEPPVPNWSPHWPSWMVLPDLIFASCIRETGPSRPVAFARTAAASSVGMSPPEPPPRWLPKLPHHWHHDAQGRVVATVVHCCIAPLVRTTPPSVHQVTPSRRPATCQSNHRRHTRRAVEVVSPQLLHHLKLSSPLRRLTVGSSSLGMKSPSRRPGLPRSRWSALAIHRMRQ
jgi:hypothetical protein